MKKIIYIICILSLFFLVGCENQDKIISNNKNITNDSYEENWQGSSVAVIYFSATNNTKQVAEVIADVSEAKLLEIIPSNPYTSADLNYTNTNCRANLEQNDPNARPAIANDISLIEYDTIFLGYPIWWGKLPKIIYTFCDRYDLSNKIVVPFCTSGGSGISTSEAELKSLEPNAIWKAGRRFSSNVTANVINDWFIELNIEVIK